MFAAEWQHSCRLLPSSSDDSDLEESIRIVLAPKIFVKTRSDLSIERVAQAANLRRVIVCVCGVDTQPVFESVTPALRVRARPLPIIFRQMRQQLHRRLTRAAKRFQRRRHVAFVITQPSRKLMLIVTLN